MNSQFAQKALFACVAVSCSAMVFADDDLLVLTPAYVPNVDVPDNLGTAGVFIEGWWVRAYNNDLVYTIDPDPIDIVSQDYDFAGRIGVEYVGPNSFNSIKFDYEHFPESRGEAVAQVGSSVYSGEAQSDYRGFSAVSEQKLLVGPYWEASLFGGLRYIQLDQMFQSYNVSVALNSVVPVDNLGEKFEARFDGIGPIMGTRGVLRAHGIGIGVSSYFAILVGQSRINAFILGVEPPAYGLQYTPVNIDKDYTFVPEFHARGFINYTYHFESDTNFTVEAGWRANQFFNFRDMAVWNGEAGLAPYSTNDQMGFAGPYLQLRVNTRL